MNCVLVTGATKTNKSGFLPSRKAQSSWGDEEVTLLWRLMSSVPKESPVYYGANKKGINSSRGLGTVLEIRCSSRGRLLLLLSGSHYPPFWDCISQFSCCWDIIPNFHVLKMFNLAYGSGNSVHGHLAPRWKHGERYRGVTLLGLQWLESSVGDQHQRGRSQGSYTVLKTTSSWFTQKCALLIPWVTPKPIKLTYWSITVTENYYALCVLNTTSLYSSDTCIEYLCNSIATVKNWRKDEWTLLLLSRDALSGG